MVLETAGWPIRSWRAASEKEPVSSTRTKVSIAVSLSMPMLPRNGLMPHDGETIAEIILCRNESYSGEPASWAAAATVTLETRAAVIAARISRRPMTPARQPRRLQGRLRGRQAALQRAACGDRDHAPRDRRADRLRPGGTGAEGRRQRPGLHPERSRRPAGRLGRAAGAGARWCSPSTAASGARTATWSSRRSRPCCRPSSSSARSLVAISPQTAPNSRKSARHNKLSFPILNDVRGEVADAFGLRFTLPDYLVELYKSLKNDLPTSMPIRPGPCRCPPAT